MILGQSALILQIFCEALKSHDLIYKMGGIYRILTLFDKMVVLSSDGPSLLSKIMKNILGFLISILLFPFLVFGQTVTPSLDPAVPTDLAAANAWRIGSTIAADSHFYYQKQDSSNDRKLTTSQFSGLFAYQPGNVVAELYYSSFLQTPTPEFQGDEIGTKLESKNNSALSLKLAIRGNRQVSVGVGYTADEIDYMTDSRKKETSFGGSFSGRLFDGLMFVGAGMQRVTISTDLSSDSMKFNKIIGGTSFHLGDPTGTMFRLEGAIELVPEAVPENGALSIQPKTTTTTAVVEMQISNWIAMYKNSMMSFEATDTNNKGSVGFNQYGIGYKMGSATFGLYTSTTSYKDSSTSSVWEYRLYQLTASYNFI